MINLNTIEIFIFRKLTNSKELIIQKKKNLYNLIKINKNKIIIKETKLLLIAIKCHYKKIIFNII